MSPDFQYLYDGEGRVCAVSAQPVSGMVAYSGYLYNAEGHRVAKGTLTSFSCNLATNGFTAMTESVLGQSGEQLSEVALDENGTMSWTHTNVYANGQLFASYDPNGLHFLLTDWLGTRRVQTDYAGVPEQTCQGMPFGDGLVCTASDSAPTEHHFTGYQHDDESGNDYAEARYYASSMGRFMSPDPSGLAYADQTNPQSLNLYSYVRNNPLIFRDPTGLECVWDDGSYDSNDDSSTGDGAVDRSGNHTGCSGAGGTWVDHSYFTDNNMADWSSQANQDLADMITPDATVTASDNGSLMDAVQNSLGNVQNNSMNLWGVWNYSALDVFKWAADPKVQHTPNGCASGILGCLYHYGNWCGAGGSGAPVDGQDSACLVHDFLYAKYGFTVTSNFKGNNPGLQEINQGLCNTSGSGAISGYFGSVVSTGNALQVNWMGNPACK